MKIVMVSIPMLAYNHEDYICAALDGVLMQNCNFNFEIVVGEDCSTDKTREIVNKYVERYPDKIRIITSDTNVGAIENAKRTLSECTGKYLALCEGDDFWNDPLKLQKQVDFLEANPDYGLVHTDVNHYNENEGRLERDINKTDNIDFPSGFIFEEYLKGDLFIKTASVVVRKDIFLQASDFDLFTKKGWVLQDLPTWLEITHKTKVKYLPETTATYRLAEESASRTSDILKQHRFHKSVYDIRFYFWENYSGNSEIKKELDTRYIATMIGDAYKLKDLALAKSILHYCHLSNLKPSLKDWVKYYIIWFLGSSLFHKSSSNS